MGWEAKGLRFLLDRNDGGAWGSDPTGEGDVIVLRSTEQTVDGRWNISDPAYRSLTTAEHDTTCLIEGDLLVTKSSGSETHIGKTTIVDAGVASLRAGYSNFMQRLRVVDQCHPRFAWYLLNSPHAKIQLNLESTTSTGLANLNGGLLGRLVFPSPPLDVQISIASYLDVETARIEGLIEEKKRLLDSLVELKSTRITEILTGKNEATTLTGNMWLPKIPSGWSLKRLKYLGQVRSGLAKGKKNDPGTRTVDLPYMRVANVQDGYIDLTDVARIEVAENEVDRYTLHVGDVLMNEGGDYDKLGRGAMWEGLVDQCLHQNHVFAVRLDDVDWAPWVAAVTRTSYAKFYFMNNSKQSTNLASINQTNVKEFPVVLPPESRRGELLEMLSEELGRMDELTHHVRRELEALIELRTATITDAVLGHIDVKTT